jgi:chemotaxis protein CheX
MPEQMTMEQTVLDAARSVFETMIFMAIETEASNDSAKQNTTAEPSLMGSITFRGSLEGCLTIGVLQNCAKVIAANMLAIDSSEEISEQEICDAMGEVANMTMGSIKHFLQNVHSDIQLSIPTVVAGREMTTVNKEQFSENRVHAMLDGQYPITFNFMYRQP